MDIQRMQTAMPSEWIAKVAKDNPAVLLESGNVRVFGRGAFVNVASPAKDSVDKATGQAIKGKYGMNLLFVSDYDLTALVKARMDLMPTAFPKNPQGLGLADPIKDQGQSVAPSEGGTNKMGKTTAGYVPGSKFVNPGANLDYKPTLTRLVGGKVEPAFGTQEELDKEFYSGAWYMATLSVFHGKHPTNPNIFYGLSSVLKIADDTRFSGGGGDGAEAYAGVNIDLAGVDPKSLF